MTILYFIVLLVNMLMSVLNFKHIRLFNILGTLFVSFIAFLLFFPSYSSIPLIEFGLGNFQISSMAGKIVLLITPIYFLIVNALRVHGFSEKINRIIVTGNLVLLLTTMAVVFDNLTIYYYFYELISLLFLFLFGLIFYKENIGVVKVFIALFFISTLINFFGIIILTSTLSDKNYFLGINAAYIVSSMGVSHPLNSFNWLIYFMIGNMIIKMLLPAFIAVQMNTSQEKSKLFVFELYVGSNTVLGVYGLIHYYAEYLKNITKELSWAIEYAPILILFVSMLFIFQNKTISNYLKQILFLYYVVFITMILQLVPINNQVAWILTAHYLIFFCSMNFICFIISDRFENPSILQPLNIRSTMPKFVFLLFFWLMLVSSFPLAAGNWVKLFYISHLISYSITGLLVWALIVFGFVLILVPLFKKTMTGETNFQNIRDINNEEFAAFFILIGLEVVIGLTGASL